MIIRALKDQFFNINVNFIMLEKEVQCLTPKYLLHCFSYLEKYFENRDEFNNTLAVLIDDSLNSTILILYCWFCGHKLIALDRLEGEETRTYKLSLFPASRVVCPEDIKIPDYVEVNPRSDHLTRVGSLKSEFLVTFTSGSTGKPKAVVHSRHNIIKCSLAFKKVFPSSNCDRNFLHLMPKYYMAGIFNALLLPITIQASVTILSAFNSR